MSRIAIVGAGLAGLTVARALSPSHDVNVFEKSRGPGGRMATRRAGDWEFDHGAQFFTARTPEFQEFLKPLEAAAVVAHWPARFAEIVGSSITVERRWLEDYPHYVGLPSMNAIGKTLAQGIDVRSGQHIEKLERCAAGWELAVDGDTPFEPYDWVILTAPAAQTAALLPDDSPLAQIAAAARMKSCFSLMLGFDSPPDITFDAALVRERDISWISMSSSKPGRDGKPAMVVHATNDWSDRNLDADIDDVREHMLDEVSTATGIDARAAAHVDVQRFRYANIDKQADGQSPIDETRRLAIAGDWLVRGRVESAFTSASRLLDGLKHHLTIA